MNTAQAYRNGKVPLVTMNVLEAACKEARRQGVRYAIEGTSRTRCYVSCSLTMAAEFGYEDHYMTAVLPLYTQEAFGEHLTCVVLDVLRIKHDTLGGEGWQFFEELWDTARRIHRGATCEKCRGRGKVFVGQPNETTCPTCDGSGRDFEKLTSWQETNPGAEYEVSSADLEKVLGWLQSGRGAAFWRSADIGNPRTFWTPLDRPGKQHWIMEDRPAAIFQTEEEFRKAVNIITRHELAQ